MHNIIVRMVIYILSPIITAAVALISGWGVSYDVTSHVLSLDLPALIGAVVAAVGLSGLFSDVGASADALLAELQKPA